MLRQLAILSFMAMTVMTASPGFPKGKIHGVNLGSWLVLEAWMLPAEWAAMGGEKCSDCSQCAASEFAFAQKYPNTVDAIFDKHWTTWFTQNDVNTMVDYGINTVRIPLGYWIVEPLVNRTTEFYPRGGIKQLKRGLKQLKAAGIAAILDHHALPGVASPGQQFAGRCTNDVEFYTPYNYHRALVWTAVMTALSHIDPDFSSVFAIEAMNEPIMDANKTPGIGDFQKNFVKVIRTVELSLGISTPGFSFQKYIPPSVHMNLTASLEQAARDPSVLGDVGEAVAEALPIILEVVEELGISNLPSLGAPQRESLVANFMDINWQYNNPANPADAKIGSQAYDNHLYYSFGGVADANEDAYLTSICNLNRVNADAALENSPLWFGEWGLPTQFNATDAFLNKWADAQKRAYSIGAGWIFWNFKTEISPEAGDLSRQWSYFEGVRRGYLTKDPTAMHDPHVCDPYLPGASTASASTSTPSMV